MPIVVYRCDVCKRSIELQRNTEGLERISRCTITHGCRGKLFQERVLLDFVRGRRPDDVPGLENYVARRVLFNHEQTITSNEWTINHNLSTFPSIQVFVDRPTSEDPDAQIEILEQDVEVVDPDTLILRFDRPETGIAQLIARQTDPNLLRADRRFDPLAPPPIQLSNLGELTIATRDTTIGTEAVISLQVTFVGAQGGQLTFVFAADDQPSVNSPWLNFDKVVIRGKTYTVRSFNILNAEVLRFITNGSTFRFTGVDPLGAESFQVINSEDMLVLLADDPFTNADIITNQIVDVSSVTETSNPFAFSVDGSEVFAAQDILQSVFPLIRSAT